MTEKPEIVVRALPAQSSCFAIREDGAHRVGTLQVNGSTMFEIATIEKPMGGGRDVLLGEVAMSRECAEILAGLLLLAVSQIHAPDKKRK